MKTKYTAVPIILALATIGCSSEQINYPNFKACYNDTKDANKCIQYIEERSYNNSTSISDPSNINPTVPNTGIDGSSALTGAAVGAAAGYMLGNAGNNSSNNDFSSNNARDRDRNNNFVGVIPVTRTGSSNTSSGTSSSTNTTKRPTTAPASKTTTSKPSLTKTNNSSKSSTSRGGFGSTGSKSFGG